MTQEQENELFQTLGRIEEGVNNSKKRQDSHEKEDDKKFRLIFDKLGKHDVRLALYAGGLILAQSLLVVWLKGGYSLGSGTP